MLVSLWIDDIVWVNMTFSALKVDVDLELILSGGNSEIISLFSIEAAENVNASAVWSSLDHKSGTVNILVSV